MTWKDEVIGKGEQRLAELDTLLQDLEDQLRNGKAEYAEVVKTLDGLGWKRRPVKVEVRGKAIRGDGATERFLYHGRPINIRAELLKELDLRLGVEFSHGEAAEVLHRAGITLGTARFDTTVYLTYLVEKGRVVSAGKRGCYRRVRPSEPKMRDTIEDGPPFSLGPSEPKGYGQL